MLVYGFKKNRFLNWSILSIIIFAFAVFNIKSSASIINQATTDDGTAAYNYNTKKMVLSREYYIKNLAKIKTSDSLFGSTSFYSASFYNYSDELLETTKDSSSVYSTYSDCWSITTSYGVKYMVTTFQFDDIVEMPIYVGKINDIGSGETHTLSYSTESSGTYTYQETSTTTLSTEVSTSISAKYLAISSSISSNITSTISETVSSSESYTISSKKTLSTPVENSTEYDEYYSYQKRGFYVPYIVAVYQFVSSSVCKLKEMYYQYAYKTSYTNLELLDLDTDEGCFYLDSSCKKDGIYYFDEEF